MAALGEGCSAAAQQAGAMHCSLLRGAERASLIL